MNKLNYTDLAKRSIGECCDCHVIDPKTKESLATGMNLNSEISIMHYTDTGKLYLFQESNGEAKEIFEVTEEILSGFGSLFECMDELEV